ncbi:MAG: ATP-binding protein [Desulfarculaceae bacterium]|jgi:MinD superfamily P-loop ATPase
MKELLVISGKGGTGKTSITAALAALAPNKVLVDLDVDAPDLHLLLQPEAEHEEVFISGNLAQVRPGDCTACGECVQLCQFGAISQSGSEPARVNPDNCEGCKLCVAMCPVQAIDFPSRQCGNWFVSRTRLGAMVHAQLYPGAENSGRLVSLLRQKARDIAQERGLDLILCDGTPGIGCPVISSLSAVDLALVVTEPTPSGEHDLLRVLELCHHFKVPAEVMVNKADLNPSMTSRLERLSQSNGHGFWGGLDFDSDFVEAMVQGRIINEFKPQGATAQALARLWEHLQGRLVG